MMNQLFRLTFVTFIWKKYKQLIVSILSLILLLWITEQLHQDFISYSQLNEDTAYLALSFIVKWVVFILLCIGFIVINVSFGKKVAIKKQSKSFFKENVVKTREPSFHKKGQEKKSESTKKIIDPFDEIRKKPHLRSKANVVLDED
ncbi:hypothetical protein [Marinomonas sp. 2405UD68-3]|uniref:hypothetical protein n=1 Tax=Marinomonas sp. 2405UD68-3 TaxID=3391835 RepID=UPI0039C99FDB